MPHDARVPFLKGEYMKKRVLAALLCVAMTATMLVGCGSTPKEDKTAKEEKKYITIGE